ncbi:olfactory receptor 13G1-like [Tachyglossus aculeatus]|uniref:olfactory receptor 13G1-like n=1 Tax=Tachyglossus aculeatus TaxID=9261 RepID=UPI0018F71461|nr:olfactory receptor 13G1-like [Tachyglossus aculeatus]
MNRSAVSEFVLLGLRARPATRPLLFAALLGVYLVAVLGNGLIVAAVGVSAALHTPTYVLLLALAVADVARASAVVPKTLAATLGPRTTISYGGCVAQLFFFTWSLGAEMVLFTAMAFDRYVAIRFPLRYAAIMSRRTCSFLLAAVFLVAVANAWVHTGLVLRLSFCGPDAVDHFFCEIPAVLALSCSPVRANEVMVFVADVALAMGDFLLTCLSYGFVAAAVLRIRSAEGKRKAFSTCSSHLCVVALYYSPVIYTYIRPASSYSFDRDKVVAALYTLVTPTLNPIVYSLRNREIQAGIRKVFSALKLPRSSAELFRRLPCPFSVPPFSVELVGPGDLVRKSAPGEDEAANCLIASRASN